MPSRAYYNEINPDAAQWLRNLIAEGLIAPGDVDERSIREVQPDDVKPYTQVHFFAGVGGWSLALRLAGWPDDRPSWTGSCPCQPFSSAGKRQGTDDDRHLWPEMFRLIRECRPAKVFGEQVASKDGIGWLDGVCADLEGAGYAVGAADLCAAGLNAPHIRQRLWWVANAAGIGLAGRYGADGKDGPEVADGCRMVRSNGAGTAGWSDFLLVFCADGKTRKFNAQPGDEPLAYGLPRSVGPGGTELERMGLMAAKANRRIRLSGYGNAIVPQVAAEFIIASQEVYAKADSAK